MTFEWDEQKRLTNLAKHGIDFEDARLIFGGPILKFRDARRDYRENRIGAYGEVAGLVLFVIYTRRGTIRRLISARKAGANERKNYHARISKGITNDAG